MGSPPPRPSPLPPGPPRRPSAWISTSAPLRPASWPTSSSSTVTPSRSRASSPSRGGSGWCSSSGCPPPGKRSKPRSRCPKVGAVAKAVTGPPRPTQADLEAARDRTIPDVIAPGLRVLFAGINPGLYSAATGYHFARPGNRFWPALYAAGFTDRVLRPEEQEDLLPLHLGITNVVARATARADELTADEVRAGGRVLTAKV